MPRENTQHQNLTCTNSEDATTEGDSPSARVETGGEAVPQGTREGEVRIAGLNLREFAKRVFLILLGAAIVSFGVHNIHNVTGITEGGIIGLVLCVDHWFGIPPSIVTPILDGLSYLIAFKVLGGGFLGWSMVATLAVGGFYKLWESLPYMLPNLSDQPLLAAVLGAVFVGVGVGIVIRQGASSGGDDAIALSIAKVTGWRVGRCYLFTDVTVLLLSLSYIPLTKIMYSLITVSLSSPLIDVVKDASWDHVEEFAEWLRELRMERRRKSRLGN